jgi:3-oxoacyl-[acyl-carrier protein] reductase
MLSDNGAAKVVIFDINEEKGQAVAESLCNGLFCKVDVSSEDSVKSGFETVRATCGRLDIMVNCAGIVGPFGKKIEDVETTSFDRVYEGMGVMLKILIVS